MLEPWSALPDDFVLGEYLERYADHIAADPARYAGRWATSWRPHGGAWREVRLELGCGKGAFAVGSALAQPDVLFVGIDVDRVCIAVAARVAAERAAANAVFAAYDDGQLARLFAPGELSRVYLNFPTPHPKGREASLRLTYADRLVTYRALLADDGLLSVRTDNQAFLSYSLAQLDMMGWKVCRTSADARVEFPTVPESGYERRAVGKGARIHALIASPDGIPVSADPGDPPPSSLYDYLPDDLDGDAYIPPEMARGIAAILRNRR
jgi:tRNA (guanine-N7-)-methyltransferase